MEERSLSWYKKRTAALNKALGTKYSPTQIYKAEQFGGFDTDIGRVLESIGDPRSRGSAEALSANAAAFISQQWSALAANNAYVYWVSNSVGGYISRDGSFVYNQTPAGDWYAVNIRSGESFPMDKEPTDAIRLTPQTANRLLQEKAQDLKPFKNRKGESVNNYLYE